MAWLQVLVVCFLSLGPPPPMLLPVDHGDKVAHVLAYFCLGAWFTALARKAPWRGWLLLVLLGLSLEVLQGALFATRVASLGDAVANGAGVAMGAVFSGALWPRWLERLDGLTWRLARSGL